MRRVVFLKQDEYIVKNGDYKSLDYLSKLERQVKELTNEKLKLEHKLEKTQDKVYLLMLKYDKLRAKKSMFRFLKKMSSIQTKRK